MTLCREDGLYEAGGHLKATWRISRIPIEDIQVIELSVLWHTEGKGDEDLQVHHFERFIDHQIQRLGVSGEHPLQCALPLTPLSYHGRLIRVMWCIRLRLFTAGGREIVAEHPFHLVAAGARAKISARMQAEPALADDADSEVVPATDRQRSSTY